MEMLSEDDLNLKDMTREELDRAWDLWFTLAQATNDFDPPIRTGFLFSAISSLDLVRRPRCRTRRETRRQKQGRGRPAAPKTAQAAGTIGWISRSISVARARFASSRSKSICNPSQKRSEVPK
jgi:hypothetical protein